MMGNVCAFPVKRLQIALSQYACERIEGIRMSQAMGSPQTDTHTHHYHHHLVYVHAGEKEGGGWCVIQASNVVHVLYLLVCVRAIV